jgi:hypothetical protein
MTAANHARRDLLAELEAENGPAETWRPEVGATLLGTLVRYSRGDTPYGPRDIAIVRVEANAKHGEYLAAVWLSYTALVREFKEKRPKAGERLAIKRLPDGIKTDAQGRPMGKGYRMYRLVVDRPVELEAPNWEALEGDDE